MVVLDAATLARRRRGRRIFRAEPSVIEPSAAFRKNALLFVESVRPSELIENIRRTGFLASGGAEFSSTFFRPFFRLRWESVRSRFGQTSVVALWRALARLALNDRLRLETLRFFSGGALKSVASGGFLGDEEGNGARRKNGVEETRR